MSDDVMNSTNLCTPAQEDELSDIFDGEAYSEKYTDQPTMMADFRNAYVGFCGDGVCPFNLFKSGKTMYIMQLVLYNLPPWMRKLPQWLLLVFIIPGASSHFFVSLMVP